MRRAVQPARKLRILVRPADTAIRLSRQPARAKAISLVKLSLAYRAHGDGHRHHRQQYPFWRKASPFGQTVAGRGHLNYPDLCARRPFCLGIHWVENSPSAWKS